MNNSLNSKYNVFIKIKIKINTEALKTMHALRELKFVLFSDIIYGRPM